MDGTKTPAGKSSNGFHSVCLGNFLNVQRRYWNCKCSVVKIFEKKRSTWSRNCACLSPTHRCGYCSNLCVLHAPSKLAHLQRLWLSSAIISDDSHVGQESAFLNKNMFMVFLSRPSWLQEWYFKRSHCRSLLRALKFVSSKSYIIYKAHDGAFTTKYHAIRASRGR